MIDEVLIITSNESKIKEISKILEDYEITAIPKTFDIEEARKDTLEEVSKLKAIAAFEHFKKPLLVDDTGIFFEAFKDFPGVVTRFIFDQIGFEGILKLLIGKRRGAYYKSCITFIAENIEPVTFTGEFHGKIAEEPSKIVDNKFPYDSIFIPNNEIVPRIELEYNKRIESSHRRKALMEFKDYLDRL
ncbi:non-canonical purine NTP pyrophosphatase [Candidatus Dependentiae bacterium]|nr:non-canonical purine NTP pyrophosphatase [Candidatus Dependentiae bacterium]